MLYSIATTSRPVVQRNALDEGFSHRPLGTRAVRLQTEELPDSPVQEAVLRLDDASVRVRSITEENDGSFCGTVYRIEPGNASSHRIAIGDQLQFRASHVFTFTGFEDSAPPAAAPRAQTSDVPVGTRRPETADSQAGQRPRRVWLITGAAALLALGIALGYVMGKNAEPMPLAAERGATLAPAELKLDYELRKR